MPWTVTSRSQVDRATEPSCGRCCHWESSRVADRLRVVIAEDNYLVREGTRRLLEDSGEVEVVACVNNATELLKAVDDMRPDAVLTDIRMPPSHQVEGIEAAQAIRARHPKVGVVVLSQHSDAAYAMQLFSGGTDGLAYLLKTRIGELEELLHALREVAEGKANTSIADSLHLSESSVEKYVNAIFSKLGLSEEKVLSRRVAAVLAYLRASGPDPRAD